MTDWPCHFEPVSGTPGKEGVTKGTTPFPTAKKQIEKQKGAGDPVASSTPSLPPLSPTRTASCGPSRHTWLLRGLSRHSSRMRLPLAPLACASALLFYCFPLSTQLSILPRVLWCPRGGMTNGRCSRLSGSELTCLLYLQLAG